MTGEDFRNDPDPGVEPLEEAGEAAADESVEGEHALLEELEDEWEGDYERGEE